jgi:hypothetical protein
MADCRPLSVLTVVGTKISVEQYPTTPTKMEDMNFVPYDSVFGSLLYAMVSAILDISQEVGVLSQFMANPRCEHWVVVKRVFRYLQGASEYSIFYHNDVSGDPHSLSI